MKKKQFFKEVEQLLEDDAPTKHDFMSLVNQLKNNFMRGYFSGIAHNLEKKNTRDKKELFNFILSEKETWFKKS